MDDVIRTTFDGAVTLRELLENEIPEPYEFCEYDTNSLGELVDFTLWTRNYVVTCVRDGWGLYPNIIKKEGGEGHNEEA